RSRAARDHPAPPLARRRVRPDAGVVGGDRHRSAAGAPAARGGGVAGAADRSRVRRRLDVRRAGRSGRGGPDRDRGVRAGAVRGGLDAGRLAGAGVWGLGRTAIKEHPDLVLRLVDLPVNASAWEVPALLRQLTESDPDEELALRGDARLVRRLRRSDPAAL